jgi:aminoglycoside 6-adenylyltransferase
MERRKMRTEKEMFDLILNTAESDDRIRAVLLNGSRADMSAKKDCFQDFDIVYIVRDLKSFIEDKDWIRRFGEIMILQMPNSMGGHTPEEEGRLVYLTQFADGNRIDLSITDHYMDDGEPTVVLLDKDHSLPMFPLPTGECYWVRQPDSKQFDDCCNEFWWLNPYVAKGLWREELSYVKHNMDHYLRDEFMKMLNWYVGVKTDFTAGTGKNGKYLKRYLTREEWLSFEKTDPDYKSENIWDALFEMDRLFQTAACRVAGHFGYHYPKEEAERVTEFIKHIRQLPKDAKNIY